MPGEEPRLQESPRGCPEHFGAELWAPAGPGNAAAGGRVRCAPKGRARAPKPVSGSPALLLFSSLLSLLPISAAPSVSPFGSYKSKMSAIFRGGCAPRRPRPGCAAPGPRNSPARVPSGPAPALQLPGRRRRHRSARPLRPPASPAGRCRTARGGGLARGGHAAHPIPGRLAPSSRPPQPLAGPFTLMQYGGSS